MPSSRSWIDRLAGKELSLNFKLEAATLILGLCCGAMQVQAAAPPPAAIAPLQLTLAIKAAKAAMAACVKEGLTVTVTVTDREGVARVVLLGDGTGALSVITSRRKAYTAAALGMTTEQLVKNLNGANDLSMIDPELVALAGGIPILRHNVVIAALGVGGADRGDADVVCAQAGIDAIKDQLD
jgi:uncharacterized protein GlcG (DUF336 family)